MPRRLMSLGVGSSSGTGLAFTQKCFSKLALISSDQSLNVHSVLWPGGVETGRQVFCAICFSQIDLIWSRSSQNNNLKETS